jgi:endonuclease/exonuclease/phosphatase family metal-dependent hydrolase
MAKGGLVIGNATARPNISRPARLRAPNGVRCLLCRVHGTATSYGRAVRLVTWNLNRATWQGRHRFATSEAHARAAWEELGSLNVDVALLQEATPPPTGLARPPTATQPAGVEREAWRSLTGPMRWWCSAVTAWDVDLRAPPDEDRCEPLHVSQKGAYAVGVAVVSDTPIVVASVYALWDYGWLPQGAKPRYAHTSLHRAISDLTPILDTAGHGMSVIVGGDFNTSSQFPSPHREAFRTVHDRLIGLGLHNVSLRTEGELLDGCPCVDEPCRHVQTYEGPTPYQDDYLFTSQDLVDRTRLVKIERTPLVEAVSDHYPLMVEVDL